MAWQVEPLLQVLSVCILEHNGLEWQIAQLLTIHIHRQCGSSPVMSLHQGAPAMTWMSAIDVLECLGHGVDWDSSLPVPLAWSQALV